MAIGENSRPEFKRQRQDIPESTEQMQLPDEITIYYGLVSASVAA